MTQRSRSWCFTLNNFEPDHETKIRSLDYQYLVYGREGKSATPHLQGYIEFSNARTFSSLKKKFPNETHLEIRKGTALQASQYCKKEDDFFEDGIISEPQGKRNDLQQAISCLKETKSLGKVAEQHPVQFVKFSKGLTLLHLQSLPARKEKPRCFWFYGPTGTGKTKEAFLMSDNIYSKNPDNKWWCNYEQQEMVLIDDLRKDHFTLSTLLRWFDQYPCRVETKGASVQLNSPLMVITSDEGPHHWYQGNDLAQLRRRFDVIKHFDGF